MQFYERKFEKNKNHSGKEYIFSFHLQQHFMYIA